MQITADSLKNHHLPRTLAGNMTYRCRSVRTLWSMSRSMQAAPVGFSRFCTAGLPPAQRIIGWEQINATGLVGVRTRPLGDRPLQAAALKLVMPSLTAGRIRGAAHSVERGERQILEHPTGGAVLYAGLSGRGRFTTRRGSQEVLPGQGIICDADQVFTRTFSDGLDALLLTVPRSALRSGSRPAGLGRPMRFGFLPGAEDQPGGAAATLSAQHLVRRIASALDSAHRGTPADLDALEAAITGLVGQVLDAGAEPDDSTEVVLDYIAAHACERGLSSEGISRALGLSSRQLSRVLARAGTTLPQAIQDQRLLQARRLLADPQHAHLAMSEVADATGFGSPEEFSRSYRRRFSIPPLRHRRILTQEESG